jgi:hypothetical protein
MNHGGNDGLKRPRYNTNRLGMEGLSVYDDDDDDGSDNEDQSRTLSASTNGQQNHVSVLLCATPSPFPSLLAIVSVSE